MNCTQLFRKATLSMSKTPHIIGLGANFYDHLFVLPDLTMLSQASGELLSVAVDGGGQVPTALVAAARLGARSELWSRVGDDIFGQNILAVLAREGVDVRGVEIVPGAMTPTSFIAVDGTNGERRIFYTSAAALQGTTLPLLDIQKIKQADALLIDSHWSETTLCALQAARAAGVPTCCDFDAIEEKHRAHFAYLDVMIVSEFCARAHCANEEYETAAKYFRSLGPKVVVITLGAKGCLIATDTEITHHSAYATDVVDTTGAGDSFRGGYVYALANRWAVNDAGDFAAAVAALNCRQLGGRAGLPTLPEVRAFMAQSVVHTP